jgi:tetratricopeptide repeat protein
MNRLAAALRAIETKRFANARDEAARLLAASPKDHHAQLFLGLALGCLGRPRAAAAFLHRARQPGFRHPVHDLVPMLPPGEAMKTQYEACLRLAPDDAALRHAYAELLIESGDPAAALTLLDPLRPDPAALMLSGIAHHDLGAFDTALDLFRRAAALAPDDPAPWSNIGIVMKILGRFDASLAAHDQALARRPKDAGIRVNRAVSLLRAGRMSEAWTDYECRFARAGQVPAWPLSRLLPDLDSIHVSGRTILATHEDGFGDTLQFVRYVPQLARRGARVLLLAPRPLAALLSRVEGVAAVLQPGDPIPEFDWHCPMFSFPRALATTLATIPNAIPYLHSNPELTAAWTVRLGPRTGQLRVGLAWAGQARPWATGFTALDARRSLDPKLLAPLGELPGVAFVSLQKDAVRLPPFPILDPMQSVADFDDTAAIVSLLDLVVSVDTSVAHLAGGLGCPVFLLDRYDNCWRWLSDREDSPWYPTLRIFRQPTPGDWPEVVARVAAALRCGQEHGRGP